MKKETREKKYNIKNISSTLETEYSEWFAMTNARDKSWKDATMLELYYYGELVYFVNSKPLGKNLFGEPFKENRNANTTN